MLPARSTTWGPPRGFTPMWQGTLPWPAWPPLLMTGKEAGGIRGGPAGPASPLFPFQWVSRLADAGREPLWDGEGDTQGSGWSSRLPFPGSRGAYFIASSFALLPPTFSPPQGAVDFTSVVSLPEVGLSSAVARAGPRPRDTVVVSRSLWVVHQGKGFHRPRARCRPLQRNFRGRLELVSMSLLLCLPPPFLPLLLPAACVLGRLGAPVG